MNYICPSLLSANFANLEADINLCQDSGADMLHVDVMDGHFVPNITIGPIVVQAIKKVSKIPLDCHLMISSPEKYIENFAKAGADFITIHAESTVHLERAIKLIKSFDVKVGVSIVPSTHENVLEYVLKELDLILLMTVNPGFGGQAFLHSQLPKIEKVRKMIEASGKNIILQVDGGIDNITAPLAKKAGANAFVSGNYLFQNRNELGAKINLLKAL
jgi:ribulose-phosphate 3-epimerase